MAKGAQPVARERTIRGVRVPTFIYGTAWKEDATKRLVRQALDAGFRAIDTANQRKHYHEQGVGDALREAIAAKLVTREQIFLQTKFTHQDGQDHRLPYDPKAPVAEQVAQSAKSSLEHLGVAALDSYVLHGPSVRDGLADEDLEAWRAMEELAAKGTVRLLGVSNVTRAQLDLLCEEAKALPDFVQNRCYARTGWDRAVRTACLERGIVYQGFSLLTGNRRELEHADVKAIAARAGLTTAQVAFRFALDVGMFPLTGSSSAAHLAEDLEVYDAAPLAEADVKRIERIAG